jgi:uncharacterized protein (TIGR03083 family)
MARSALAKDILLESLLADGGEFRAAVAAAGPGAAAPSCPDWTVGTLIHHVGSVYRFVTSHLTRGITTPPEKRYPAFFAEAPATDLLAWWDTAFERLTSTLDVIDPDMPAWNWAPQAKNAGFWHRRMAHETAIHRWDAQMAIGRAEPIDPQLATDGVAEVLDTWLQAGRRREFRPVTGIVELHAADTGQDWYVRLRGEGISLLDTDTIFGADDPQPTVVATGPASDLNLALWGRVGFDILDIEGDEEILESLRTDDRR